MADVHPIRYRDDVEVVPAEEDEVVADIVAMMRKSLQEAFDTHRQIASGTHAKTHGVVTGRLTVGDDLPPELAQGLFAQPGTYEIVLRYSSEPGTIETDTVPRARGASLKVLDVPGEKLQPGWTSQDFLFNTWSIIPPGDANAYHQLIHERSGEVEALRESPDEVGLFDRTPNINPVAHFYFTQGAFRFGDHVAKLCLAPVTSEQHEAGKREVTPNDPPGVLSELAREYHAAHPARYELRVQLCTDLDSMPVEDASIPWDEQVSPYRRVATIDIPPQESFSPERRVYAERVMSWRPWNGLVAHRPLGSINRLRHSLYRQLGEWRHQTHATAEHHPTRLEEVPD